MTTLEELYPSPEDKMPDDIFGEYSEGVLPDSGLKKIAGTSYIAIWNLYKKVGDKLSPKVVRKGLELTSINCTQWFRDFPVWKRYWDSTLAELVKSRPLQSNIKVASLGCSTGEEAYTLAVLLAEQFGVNAGWRVEAYDLNYQNLHTTSLGKYRIQTGGASP